MPSDHPFPALLIDGHRLTCQSRGEPGVGKWTIIVKDTKVDEHTGTFIDWHLKLWGECIDPAKAKVLPMPNEDDDKDHASIATTTLPVTTVTVAPDPNQKTTAPLANPTDHPDRPQKVRPSTTSSSQPTPPPASATDGVPAAATTTPANSSWLPGFLPTFGVSSRTQAWIYGALGLVVAFCCGLGLWLWLARRRRLRNAGITGGGRDDYEFELLEEDDEAEGLTTGEKAGGKRKRGKKTRGGELYDAFAGGSDDDLDLDSTVDGSDDDGDYGGGNGRGRGAYRDDVPGASGSGSGSASGGSNGPKGRRRLSLDSQEDNPRHVVGDDEDEEEDDEAVTRREVQEQGDRLLGRRT